MTAVQLATIAAIGSSISRAFEIRRWNHINESLLQWRTIESIAVDRGERLIDSLSTSRCLGPAIDMRPNCK